MWACTSLLANAVSTLPIVVYRQGAPEPLPLPPVLQRPAAGMSRPDWLHAAMRSLLLAGNCYGLIADRAGSGMRPTQVELVDPSLVTASVMPDGRVEWRYRGTPVDRADLWHIPAYPVAGSPVGLSPVTHAAATIGLGLSADRFSAQFFTDGASPVGLLRTDQRLDEQTANAAKDRLIRSTRGKREPLVLGSGLSFDAIQLSPEDAALLASQKFTVQQVARLYNVPPEMIGGESGSSMTYSNTEARALDFVKFTLRPWIIKVETALSDLLPRGQYVRFNLDGLLRGTARERYQAHEIGLHAGFLTVNEVPRPRRPATHPDLTMPLARPCLDCGSPTRAGSRCPPCATGHDQGHRATRKLWVPHVRHGVVTCWRCGKPIAPASPWDLGHRPGLPSHPEHTACNRATGRDPGRRKA